MTEEELQQWWRTPEHLRVVKILRDVGVDILGNFDGCCCCHFKIRNVEIDTSCGKGAARGVIVGSPSLDYWEARVLLRPIAEEVARQVEESDGRGAIPILFRASACAKRSHERDMNECYHRVANRARSRHHRRARGSPPHNVQRRNTLGVELMTPSELLLYLFLCAVLLFSPALIERIASWL